MRKLLILLEREMKAYFYSPIAYVVLCFYLALTGFNIYAMVSLLNRGPTDFTLVEAFFSNTIFWFGFLLIVPLITMRLYSEEFKMGTIETLLTAPVHDWQVVGAKFAGALLFYVILELPTALYFAIFQWITLHTAASALGAFAGSYLLLLLLGMFYLSIGCLASVVTRNQIIAAVISLVTIVLIFFTGLLGFILPNISQSFRDLVSYFSTVEHMRDFSRGLIDTRPIVYYLSMTLLLQVITFQIFQFRKWKS
jgi:ABC-2 type transport system permease protein